MKKKSLEYVLEELGRHVFITYVPAPGGLTCSKRSVYYEDLNLLVGWAQRAEAVVKTLREKAIEVGVAGYNPKTGEFEWHKKDAEE